MKPQSALEGKELSTLWQRTQQQVAAPEATALAVHQGTIPRRGEYVCNGLPAIPEKTGRIGIKIGIGNEIVGYSQSA
eukprot:6564379-Ditylum_brightwellii.AAC.1